MPQIDRRPLPYTPIAPPSLSLTQMIGLFVELRELAALLVDQQRQLVELLKSRPAELVSDDLNMFTVAEVAKNLAFDPKTIHRLIAEGELEAVGSGQRLRIPMVSVRAYIMRHRTSRSIP